MVKYRDEIMGCEVGASTESHLSFTHDGKQHVKSPASSVVQRPQATNSSGAAL